MKHHLRRIVAFSAAIPLLGIAFVSAAAPVRCPAVGTILYQGNTCSTASSTNAPCYKYVVTSVSGGRAYANKYANGYYQWVYVERVSFACT
jgi:hypothetical protein